LAEKDGVGCEPREAKDYEAMKRIVEGLDADVIAFQEAENPIAAGRVFDPAKYMIVMEQRAVRLPARAAGGILTNPSIGRWSVLLCGEGSRLIATPT